MEKIFAKTIVTHNKGSAWFGIDYNMNIYRGCCHGCIYCDSRSECYGIEEFDRVRVKDNALELIRNELRRKVKRGVVGTGAMSDPYNPFEKELQLTRHALELIDTFQFGAAIATKSDLITRDIDILQSVKAHSPVLCKITITAWDDALCEKLEPNAPPSSKRFDAVEKLSQAGIFTGILLMPVLPYLEDSEENVLEIVRMAKEHGARFVYPQFGVTLRKNQRDFFFQKLDERFPKQNLTERYRQKYGYAYECRSPKASQLWNIFTVECDRLGLLYRMQDIVQAYKLRYENSQLRFF